MTVWPRADDPHFCHTSAVIFTFLIRHFSECCCGPRETHNYVLRHPYPDPWVAHFCHMSVLIFTFSNCVISLRPSLSSTSSNNDSNYKHSWTAPFWSSSIIIDFRSKTLVIINILGLHPFWSNDIIFIIFIFPEEILTFWRVQIFMILSRSVFFARPC